MILADLAVMSITFATVATALGAIGLFVRDLFSQPAAATRQRLGLAPEEPAGDFDWQWYRQGVFGSDDQSTGLAVTAEGDAYVCGYWGGFGSGLDVFVARLRPAGWETALSWWDGGGWDDGALALSLGPGGVCLAGSSGGWALMLRYGKDPVAP